MNEGHDDQIVLTVVGSGDAFGSGGRLNTCFYVKATKTQFLIDCGATTLVGLKRASIRPEDIDMILITHFHGDHFGGLPFFLLERAVHRPSKPLTIVSPPGCKERLADLLNLLYPSSVILEKLKIKFIEYRSYELLQLDHLTVLPVPVVHTEASLPHGLRVTVDNKILSYSGDTEWTGNLVTLAEDADLFICECNFYRTRVMGHLDYFTLGSKLPMLSYKKIMLTHFDNEMLDNLENVAFDCAEDGKVLRL